MSTALSLGACRAELTEGLRASEGVLDDGPQLPWPATFGGPGSSVRRLSRDELWTTMNALIGTALPRDDFPEEQRSGHGPLLLGGIRFLDPEVRHLWQTIRMFAASAAPRVLSRSTCVDAECLRAFARDLGSRALKRPLTAKELEQLDLAVADGGADEESRLLIVEGLLERFLFSPSFLFRLELRGSDPSEPSRLRDDDVAVRLSYLATLAPPDDELAGKAARGELASAATRRAEYLRLSATPLGRRAIAIAVLEWLNSNESKVSQKSAVYLSGLPEDVAAQLRTSIEDTISTLAARGELNVGELLRTTNYLNDPIVRAIAEPRVVAGLESGDGPLTRRSGALLHPYVIASHTKENGLSPFQLGVALKDALFCAPVSAPPAGATELKRTDPTPELTSRESLEYMTSATPVCERCHSQFAPIGYSMMPFDPVGRWQSRDPASPIPWDVSGELETHDGSLLAFSDAANLQEAMSQSPQVLGCAAALAVRWTFGRELSADDADLIVRINDLAQSTGGALLDLFAEVVASDKFLENSL